MDLADKWRGLDRPSKGKKRYALQFTSNFNAHIYSKSKKARQGRSDIEQSTASSWYGVIQIVWARRMRARQASINSIKYQTIYFLYRG